MQPILASTCLALFMALVSGLPMAQAEESKPNDAKVAAKLQAGNRAIRAGNLQDALNAYQEAAALDPDNDAAVYNQAVAIYRSGEFSKAAELFQRAAASENAAVAANARFNLGNTAYAQALASVEENPAKAAEGLERAIASYRQSLSLNPNDQDARTNIELAAKLLQQLQSQQEEQQQQQQDEDQGEEQQPSPESEQQEDNQEEESGEGQESSQQTQEDQVDTDESQQGDESQESSQTENSPDSEESSPSESDDPDSRESPEQSPAEIQDPRGELAAANQEDETQVQAGQAGLDDSATMTLEEAQKMLQAIRDRDMLRRFQRQQRERTRGVPVEKDW